MLIGELSEMAEVSIDTVRYYERQGLILPVHVRDSGYREFDGAAVSRLRFILRAKNLGFSLKQIKSLLALKESPDTTCADVRILADHKLAEVRQKIQALEELERELVNLIRECTHPDARVGSCPIVETIEGTKK